MPDFDVLSLLEIRKRKSRSHGIRKKRNGKRKKRALKRSKTSLKDLSKLLEDHGRHSMLSFLSSLPISVLRILDTEANKFYDRNHQLYDAALLTRCFTQHALRPFIHIMTGNLKIISDSRIRYIVSKGLKYRFPCRIDFKKCREEIASALNDFGNRWCKREYVEPDAFSK